MTQQPFSGPKLAWTDEQGQYYEQPLHEGSTLVGRSPECDLIIDSPMVSREHARFDVSGGEVTVHDLQSRNGVFVNGARVPVARVRGGDNVNIGNVVLTLASQPVSGFAAVVAPGDTVVAGGVVTDVAESEPMAEFSSDRPDATVTMVAPIALAEEEEPAAGIVSDHLLRSEIIRESDIVAAGVELKQVEYVTLGAGMGSFVFADLLRCSGVDAQDIVTVGTEEVPYARYQRLCSNSQIPPHERLRSNSESCPDNVWGFPAYATREAWHSFTHGKLFDAAWAMWSVFGEPAIAQTYTPRSGDVFSSLDREAGRIGWNRMLTIGRVRAIRKTDTGRLAVVVSHSNAEQRRHSVISARFVHLSFGYPAIQMLPDLAAFRERYGDFFRVVNAYENHTGVYDHLRANGGVVLLRGRGIVASRIIQRLYEERAHNPNITVVHLHRSRLTEGRRFGLARRRIEEQFEFQPFNWPKACWSGENRGILEKASEEERRKLLAAWGGTTTASRRDWRRMVREGTAEGWYRTEFGEVTEVVPAEGGRIATRIASALTGGGTLELVSDFVIDCVGLEAGPSRSPVLDDLIKTYNLPLSPVRRLKVSNNFEVEGMRHTDSRFYAAGAVTLGGAQAAVDSFLGLQYAALWAKDGMLASGMSPRGLRQLRGLYSFGQWFKWMRGVAP